jgi:ribonucleoside-diphosphate reductase alpha chain
MEKKMDNYFGIKLDLDKDKDFTEFAYKLLEQYYLVDGETSPQQSFARAALAYSGGDLEFAQRIYDYASKSWFVYASPVLSNAPTPGKPWKALPISCFLTYVDDTLEGLIDHTAELRWLSIKGGGVGGHWSSVRSVSNKAPGPIPFLKTVDADMNAYRQGTCYTPDTEVLTSAGWVRFDQLPEDVEVGHVNSNREIFFAKPIELVVEEHVGQILNVRTGNNSVDLQVTPNHSMVIERKNKVNGKKEWDGRLVKIRADQLPRNADVRFHTAALKVEGTKQSLTPHERFLIAFQADGSNNKSDSGCVFHLKKERKIVRIEEILNDCGYSFTKVKTNYGTTKFYVHAPIIGNKSFSWVNLNEITASWGQQFIEELSHWDSGSRGEGYEGFTYSTTVKENANIVQAIVAISNMTSRMMERVRAEPRKNIYTIYIRPYQHLTLQKVNVAEVPYSGKVYCATVSTGMLLVRRSGVVTICGNTRKGSYAAYLDISHPDILEFLNMRVPTGGDPNRKCFNLHNAVNITDDFMQACIENKVWELKDPADGTVRDTIPARELLETIIEVRYQTGEPYLNFIDTANRNLPQPLKDLGLKIHGSNLCNEIHLPTGPERTAVCCLSSLNLRHYDEWKDTTIVKDLVRFLDNVLQVFIDQAPPVLHKAIYSATRERSLGLGAMGFHDLLQSKNIPWESVIAKVLNMEVFSHIKSQAVEATEELAKERGEYLDGIGSGRRNSHILAIAPNANSSIIANTSASIEPWKSNAYTHRTRTGSFLVKNPELDKVLSKYIPEDQKDSTWQSIILAQGSVQHLQFLSEWEKSVFKTAFELDQRWVVDHAASRQEFICQGQSVNLFFPAGGDRNYVLMTHLKAWKDGLKGLYYLRTSAGVDPEKVSTKVERVALADYVAGKEEECLSCQG